MNKTEKELAFLRDLYITPDWTARFTNIFDENFKFTDERTILYVNPGTGDHAIELRRKLKGDAQLKTFGENPELNRIAQAKADIVKAKINFTNDFPRQSFDAVIADASLVEPKNLSEFFKDAAGASDKQVVIFLPTASSFGEIFSFLWETFFAIEMHDKAAEVERLILEIPPVSKVEQMAAEFDLTRIETVTKTEFFDFKDGAEFVASPLVADFLFPVWLDFLNEKEKERVRKKLAQIVDTDDGALNFRFSVKATLVSGEKK
ncbi:MAG TPA: class I SAM-dependent methyltransferase [Pyrinomonadaceae bacterium]|nr:class I SAM-dependent methyltransferase [Pyrinomonadaceae bacterium]